MRAILFVSALLSACLLAPMDTLAQRATDAKAERQLSVHAQLVLRREGLIGFESNRVSIGPDSLGERTAIIGQCEEPLTRYFDGARIAQFGEDRLVAGAADVLASTIGMLAQARSGPQGMQQLKDGQAHWSAEAVRTGSSESALLACFLAASASLATGQSSPIAGVPPPAPPADTKHRAAVAGFAADAEAFNRQSPPYAAWNEAEKQRYALFNLAGLSRVLERYKADMQKAEYENIAGQLSKLRGDILAKCPDCKAEYPGGPLSPNEPNPAMQGSHILASASFEMAKSQRSIDANVAAVAGKPAMTIHNRANDATACIAVEPTGVKKEWGIEGRYRLRNTCGYPVDASWCANTAECGAGRGNLWTIPAGKDWPIYFADISSPNIQVGACKAGEAKQPPLGHQGVERTGFDASRDSPQPGLGVTLLPGHRCE